MNENLFNKQKITAIILIAILSIYSTYSLRTDNW